jgi:myosin-15
MQRAFLQSAMAQNIQIQQQLIAQNNALQQLLQQQVFLSQMTSPESRYGEKSPSVRFG